MWVYWFMQWFSLQFLVGGLRLLMEANHLLNLDHFPLVQTVKSSPSSTSVSVWMTVLRGTLPASSRSVCAAILTVPRATARVLTTAKCVATREPSVTTENVWLTAATTLTTTRLPTNAEVGQAVLCWWWFNGAKGMKRNSDLGFLECDRSCLTCSGHGPSSCLSCDTNRRRDASGHCVWFNRCDLTSYMDQDGQCHQCHKSCHRCSGAAETQCLSCNKPSFLLGTFCL